MKVSIPIKRLAPGCSVARLTRFALGLGWAAVLIGIAPSVDAAEPSQELRPANLSLLYSESLFSNVNRNDALAAIKSWIEILGRRRGFKVTVDIGFSGRVEETSERLREQTVDVVTCTSLEYFQLAPAGLIDPMFLPGWKQVSDDYVMITRRDPNLGALADLRGQSVVYYQTGAGLGRLWVEASLDASGLGSVNDFFSLQSEATKVSSVILPLFFGKTDVAVAKRQGWETMKEMNPQLAVRLQVLTHSASLPDAVICLAKASHEHPFRDDFVRGMAGMETDPQGQQKLLLFKTDKMVGFQPQYLDGVRALLIQSEETVPLPETKTAVRVASEEPKS